MAGAGWPASCCANLLSRQRVVRGPRRETLIVRAAARPQRILLGIAAGIAADEVLELTRRFVQQGASVQLVMTAEAAAGLAAQPLQALTGSAPRSALFDAAHEAAMGHIELARWPDAIVIAPAGATLLAAMAAGRADDLLTTLLLATDKPVFAAPAMEAAQWQQPETAARLKLLAARGIRFVAASTSGALAAAADIHAAVLAALTPPPQRLQGLHAVVTAGPTREPIDPVRFISNRSSGKQGFAVAAALQDAGARVTLIAGPSALDAAAGITRIDVESAQQMLAASLAAAASADLLVAAAAVADYRVQTVATQKTGDAGDTLALSLLKNPDIVASMRSRYPQLFLVGFAAETERLHEHARDKLQRKGLDLIAANWVGGGKAFDTEDNALSVLWAGGQQEIATAPKTEVARQLVQLIAARWQARETTPG